MKAEVYRAGLLTAVILAVGAGAYALVTNGTATLNAGEVLREDIGISTETARFSGLFGDVTGAVYLSDENTSFYSFGSEQPYTWVIATQGSEPVIANLEPLNSSDLAILDASLGWPTIDSDSMTQVFSEQHFITIDGENFVSVPQTTIGDWNISLLGNKPVTSLLDVTFAINVESGTCHDASSCEYSAVLPAGNYNLFTSN